MHIAEAVEALAEVNEPLEGEVEEEVAVADNGAEQNPTKILIEINRADDDDIEEVVPVVTPDEPTPDAVVGAGQDVVAAVTDEGDDVEFVLLRV